MTVRNNLVAFQAKDPAVRYEAGLKSYQSVSSAYARSNRFAANLISGYSPVFSVEKARPVTLSGNKVVSTRSTPLTGSAASCSVRLNSSQAKWYGHTYHDAP